MINDARSNNQFPDMKKGVTSKESVGQDVTPHKGVWEQLRDWGNKIRQNIKGSFQKEADNDGKNQPLKGQGAPTRGSGSSQGTTRKINAQNQLSNQVDQSVTPPGNHPL